ncbi:MAG: hypothetical protein DRP01_10200, partial [Archaeoglobales archaeon]
MCFLWKARRLTLLPVLAVVFLVGFLLFRRFFVERQPAQISVSLSRASNVILSSNQVSQVAQSQADAWIDFSLEASGLTEMQAHFVPEVGAVGVTLSIAGSSETPIS